MKNHRCNLIVLGEARVGKTSLIRSLLQLPFEPKCESTKGVHLCDIGAGVAERTDIVATEDSWKEVKPLEEVKSKFHEAIAKEVSAVTAAAKKVEQSDDKSKTEIISEKDLSQEVDKILRKIKIPAQKLPLPRHQIMPTEVPNVMLHDMIPEFEVYQSDIADDLIYSETTPLKSQVHKSHLSQSHSKPKQRRAQNTTTAAPPKEPKKKRQRKRERQHTRQATPRTEIPYRESRDIAKAVRHVPKKVQKNDLTFHTIDFAGQKLYRHMHHCFITRKAMYIVVFKLPTLLEYLKRGKGASNTDDPFVEIRYWLNNIVAHAGTEEDMSQCRIFLVGTHKQPQDPNHGRQLIDEEVSEIDQELKKRFLFSEKENRFLKSFVHCSPMLLFPLENSLSDSVDTRGKSGITQLMNNLKETSTKLKFLSIDYPTNWLKFEEKLIEMNAERKESFLSTTRAKVRGWAKECGIEDDEGFKAALTFYHDIRVIVDQALVISPFPKLERPTTSNESDELILLSPQRLGEMMSKIVELKIGVEDYDQMRMKVLENKGVICLLDLQKCLGITDNDSAFKNLVQILTSYCLIYKLNTHKKKLLLVGEELAGDVFLVPCRLPKLQKSDYDKISFPPKHYQFQFEFESYLPEEVYLHVVCQFLEWIDEETQEIVLRDSCCKFANIAIGNEKHLMADWKIEMNRIRHRLIFSLYPRPKESSPKQPQDYFVGLRDEALVNVCQKGSLGCVSYAGGPVAHCFCVPNDSEVLLKYIINDEKPEAEVLCPRCNSTEYNVHELLTKMVPVENPGHAEKEPTSVNVTNIHVVTTGDRPIATANPLATSTGTGVSDMPQLPPLTTDTTDRALDSTKDDSLMFSIALKIVEKCNDLVDQERQREKLKTFSKFLNLKKDWSTIQANQDLDEDEKLKELLIKWITRASANNDAKVSKLIKILEYMEWNDIAKYLEEQSIKV